MCEGEDRESEKWRGGTLSQMPEHRVTWDLTRGGQARARRRGANGTREEMAADVPENPRHGPTGGAEQQQLNPGLGRGREKEGHILNEKDVQHSRPDHALGLPVTRVLFLQAGEPKVRWCFHFWQPRTGSNGSFFFFNPSFKLVGWPRNEQASPVPFGSHVTAGERRASESQARPILRPDHP